jgi:hypothetical protein
MSEVAALAYWMNAEKDTFVAEEKRRHRRHVLSFVRIRAVAADTCATADT